MKSGYMLNLIGILGMVGCVIFLVYNREKENYNLMFELGKNIRPDIIAKKQANYRFNVPYGTSLKYGPGSDYFKFRQRRAIGQDRDSGEDT